MPTARAGEVRASRRPEPRPAAPRRKQIDWALRSNPRRLLKVGALLVAMSWLAIAIVSALDGWPAAGTRLVALMVASFVAGGGSGMIWVGWHDATRR
jgi:hypothetical protein